jgi:putative peptide zinc metalloprotease protein
LREIDSVAGEGDQALGSLRQDLRVSPFDEDSVGDRRYLVEFADRSYLISPAAFDVLAALAEGPSTFGGLGAIIERNTGRRVALSWLREMVQGTLPPAFFSTVLPPRRTALRLTITLIPEVVVARLARHLTWCFDRRLVGATLAAFVLVVAAVIGRATGAVLTPISGFELAILYGTTLLSVLVHELGHAAACLRFGCPPGRIGIGMYLIFPTLFTDVTRAWRLPARHRAVVDLGGLYFQGALMVVLGVYGFLTSSPVALQLFWIALFSMFYTLNPVFKMDGYWLLSDLSGLPNLHRRMGEGVRNLLGPNRCGSAARAHRARRRIVIPYVGLVLLHAAFVGHLVVRAFPEKVMGYPQAVGAAIDQVAAAWSRAAFLDALRGAGKILADSLWPACLVFLTIRVVIATARFIRGRGLAAGAGRVRRTVSDGTEQRRTE